MAGWGDNSLIKMTMAHQDHGLLIFDDFWAFLNLHSICFFFGPPATLGPNQAFD